jgi:tripartite-type tricarboxylate transporter receptor subunit TctC
MSQSLNQSVVVEKCPGAGGTIEIEAIAHSAADGYTMLYGSQGPSAASSATSPLLRYHP